MLRDEAVAALALSDITQIGMIPIDGRVSNEGLSNPDRVVAQGPDGRMLILSVTDGSEITSFGSPTEGTLTEACFSPDGKYVATRVSAEGENLVTVWDTGTGDRILVF